MESGRSPLMADGLQCIGLSVRARASAKYTSVTETSTHDVTLIIDDKDALYGT